MVKCIRQKMSVLVSTYWLLLGNSFIHTWGGGMCVWGVVVILYECCLMTVPHTHVQGRVLTDKYHILVYRGGYIRTSV